MTRDDLQTLLPFRANGTLEGSELDTINAALADDADLRAELNALVAIRETLQAEPVQSPGEFGLARLMHDVDATSRRTETPVAANDNVVPITRLRIWQVAAAVVLAFGLGINSLPTPGGAPEFESAQFDFAPDAEGGGSAAGGAGFALASGEDAADYTVIFNPDATETEIRSLLLAAGLEISGGPSALGIYGLSLIDSGAEDDARIILANSDIIEELQ